MLLQFFRNKNMIKLQMPEGGTSVSFNEKVYEANKNGVVQVPSEAVADLVKFHNLTPFIEQVTKEKLFADVLNKIENPKDLIKEEVDELDELDVAPIKTFDKKNK